MLIRCCCGNFYCCTYHWFFHSQKLLTRLSYFLREGRPDTTVNLMDFSSVNLKILRGVPIIIRNLQTKFAHVQTFVSSAVRINCVVEGCTKKMPSSRRGSIHTSWRLLTERVTSYQPLITTFDRQPLSIVTINCRGSIKVCYSVNSFVEYSYSWRRTCRCFPDELRPRDRYELPFPSPPEQLLSHKDVPVKLRPAQQIIPAWSVARRRSFGCSNIVRSRLLT